MLWGALKNHWPEYLIEAAGLGCFMVSACAFAVLIFYPASPVVAAALLGPLVAAPEVNYAVTRPGECGVAVAFAAEAVISFLLMTVILNVSNARRRARWAGLCAGALVAFYISVENPLSGMSMNPARTFSSALAARAWTALWLYFTAPPLGMLAAAETFARTRGARAVLCAKLHHQNAQRCIFNCGYAGVRCQVSDVSKRQEVLLTSSI
ncbi:MAG: aquaporin [Acidobacteriota bacterium]|nr:aquaporin [Acidobacteriota bacterium]